MENERESYDDSWSIGLRNLKLVDSNHAPWIDGGTHFNLIGPIYMLG